MSQPKDLYPKLEIPHIKNPQRLFAIPIIGFLIKFIIVIPQYIMILFAGIAWIFAGLLINPFVVLFTGKYWDPAYKLSMALLRMSVKITTYFFGLTNEYPGFNFDNAKSFTLDMPKPEKPNRLFAVPFFGFVVRIILLIPYYIYSSVIYGAAQLGATGSSFVVLFQGKYPESTYELGRDANRLLIATNCYIFGLSDSYPSFWISMNHKNIKIALIVLSALYCIMNYSLNIAGTIMSPKESKYDSQYQQKEVDYQYEDNMELEEEYTPPAT